MIHYLIYILKINSVIGLIVFKINWFTFMRDILEIIYFISGPVIAIGVIYAIKQYWQMKKDIFNKYEREIVSSTINDVHHFNTTIQPLYKKYLDSLNGVMIFSYDLSYQSLTQKELLDASNNFFNSINESSVFKAEEVIKEMNKFALSYTFGLSDEKKAKSIIGVQYIEFFESLLFLFSIYTEKGNMNFNDAYELYKIWNNENLINKATQTIKEKEKIINEIKAAAQTNLRPIGR